MEHCLNSNTLSSMLKREQSYVSYFKMKYFIYIALLKIKIEDSIKTFLLLPKTLK